MRASPATSTSSPVEAVSAAARDAATSERAGNVVEIEVDVGVRVAIPIAKCVRIFFNNLFDHRSRPKSTCVGGGSVPGRRRLTNNRDVCNQRNRTEWGHDGRAGVEDGRVGSRDNDRLVQGCRHNLGRHLLCCDNRLR